MLAKGRVMCTYDRAGVSVNVILWKCTSEPDPSAQDLESELDLGTWGCGEIANTPYAFDAIANVWSDDLVAASDEGPQADAEYIAITVGPGVDMSVSQVTSGNQWLP